MLVAVWMETRCKSVEGPSSRKPDSIPKITGSAPELVTAGHRPLPGQAVKVCDRHTTHHPSHNDHRDYHRKQSDSLVRS